jgi:hypothetical protein
MLVSASSRRVVALATALMLGSIACSSDSPKTQASASSAPLSSTASSTSSTSSASSTSSSSSASGEVIAVTVSGGAVAGGVQRKKIALGAAVVLRVTSDIADEVHLHGYDKKADVDAGGTVDIQFTADIPGVFEAELEAAKLKLVELEIS